MLHEMTGIVVHPTSSKRGIRIRIAHCSRLGIIPAVRAPALTYVICAKDHPRAGRGQPA